jgi:tRNA-dihydrouridine synthase B
MAGVTDAPFRKIAREFGAGMACTEMISSEALVRQHRESFRLMDLAWDERPVSVQLMGGDPAVMAEAARMAEAAGADIVDINMGPRWSRPRAAPPCCGILTSRAAWPKRWSPPSPFR